MKRIGLYGGTFDPVHLGHLEIAKAALRNDLDRLVVVPCWISPHKMKESEEHPPASTGERFGMLHAAFDRLPGVEISRFEIERREPSYTHRTIDHLQALHPDARIVLIVGWDQYRTIETWYAFPEWSHKVELLVFRRKGLRANKRKLAMDVRFDATPIPDVSATLIREKRIRGEPIDGLIPPPVLQYIKRHGLYLNGSIRKAPAAELAL